MLLILGNLLLLLAAVAGLAAIRSAKVRSSTMSRPTPWWLVVGLVAAWGWILVWCFVSLVGVLAADACDGLQAGGFRCGAGVALLWCVLMVGQMLIVLLTRTGSNAARPVRYRVLALVLAAAASPLAFFAYAAIIERIT
jgi:hypothetical protein